MHFETLSASPVMALNGWMSFRLSLQWWQHASSPHLRCALASKELTWVNKKSQGSTSCFISELSFKYFPLVTMPPFLEVSFGCGASDENEMCHQCRMADLFSGVAIPTKLHNYGFLADPVQHRTQRRSWKIDLVSSLCKLGKAWMWFKHVQHIAIA